MKQPSERLIPVLYTIEIAAAVIHKLHPSLADNDVKYVYEAFHKYFKGEVRNQELPEPSSTIKRRDNLISLIFQHLEQAELDGDFVNLLDGSFAPAGQPIVLIEEIYVLAFNYLRKSARFWQKKQGPKGYLNGPVKDLGEVELNLDNSSD
ncbi:MAG: hypothetical protein AAF433_13220 [Bacteroidota bacterium]